MDAAEIVEGEVERQRVNVVFELLREGVRQPREAPHRHAHGEVLGFGLGAILINAVIIGILLYYARWSVKQGYAAGVGWEFHRTSNFDLFGFRS